MGNMTMNMILRSYVLGFNGSLITSLSQAFGSKHLVRMGDIVNKAFVLYSVCLIPLIVFLFFTKSILMLFGQTEKLSEATQTYVRIAMFGFFCQLYYDIYRKLLNSMRLFHTHAPVTFITFVLHVGWCFLVIYYLELGVVGGGIISVVQSFSNFLIIYMIVHCLGYGKEAMHGFTKAAFEGWWDMFKQGIPTYFFQLLDFLSIEITILIGGYIDIEILVANTSLLNILYIFFLYVYAIAQS